MHYVQRDDFTGFELCDGTRIRFQHTHRQSAAQGSPVQGFNWSWAGRDEMQAEDLEAMLGQMIDCGREYERRTLAGERYAFANMANALREIARGTHRPYPCGRHAPCDTVAHKRYDAVA